MFKRESANLKIEVDQEELNALEERLRLLCTDLNQAAEAATKSATRLEQASIAANKASTNLGDILKRVVDAAQRVERKLPGRKW